MSIKLTLTRKQALALRKAVDGPRATDYDLAVIYEKLDHLIAKDAKEKGYRSKDNEH